MHLIGLHDTGGSSNPFGLSSNSSRVTMSPYYLFKDLITLFMFIWVLSFFVYFMPNVLGDSENYVPDYNAGKIIKLRGDPKTSDI